MRTVMVMVMRVLGRGRGHCPMLLAIRIGHTVVTCWRHVFFNFFVLLFFLFIGNFSIFQFAFFIKTKIVLARQKNVFASWISASVVCFFFFILLFTSLYLFIYFVFILFLFQTTNKIERRKKKFVFFLFFIFFYFWVELKTKKQKSAKN